MATWIDLDSLLDVDYLRSIDAELEATIREIDGEKEVTNFYPSLPPFRLNKLPGEAAELFELFDGCHTAQF